MAYSSNRGELLTAIAVSAALFATVPCAAQVKIGVTLSTTGPAASLGIPEKNTLQLVAATAGAKDFEFIFLDDASDTTAARRNVEKLTAESGVDVIIGSSTSPNSLAMIQAASKAATPMISLAAASRIIEPMDSDRRWSFKTAFGSFYMANVAVKNMVKSGVKTLAFIGYNDAYGEDWWNAVKEAAAQNGVQIVANERYNPTDTSVTAQVLKIMASRPDAILIGASGTPAVLPQAALAERGYNGKIYQNQGVINADYLRLGGKTIEGTLLPSSPAMVSKDLPDDHPAKAAAVAYQAMYEGKYGAGTLSGLGANAYDAWLIVQAAAAVAEKIAKPGTLEFRNALRDAVENVKGLKATGGLIEMTANDHFGFGMDAPVMITVKGGSWALVK